MTGLPEYHYRLPEDLIAKSPAEPRDSSRLLVYDIRTDQVFFDVFSSIHAYIPRDSVLVLNDTKVFPARLELIKNTGGTVRILFLVNEWDGNELIRGLPDRKIGIGDTLFLERKPFAEVVSQKNEEFTFKLFVSPDEFRTMCEYSGKTPLPPYIKSDLSEEEVRRKYQTVFAHKAQDQKASVAAPTASLHFTDGVFESLEAKGVQRAYVTLHVGRGTFSPVNEEALNSNKLHSEPIHIPAQTSRIIAEAKKEGRAVIAAGTTALRTIESASESILAGESFAGETSIFIKPPYDFKIADGLITNFHLPGTSLLMLVDAFLRFKGAKKSWKELYEIAKRENFRFYSFGDAMLIV